MKLEGEIVAVVSKFGQQKLMRIEWENILLVGSFTVICTVALGVSQIKANPKFYCVFWGHLLQVGSFTNQLRTQFKGSTMIRRIERNLQLSTR